ncbi:MAG: glycosyltransferase family 4 protein [Hyphomicrobium sp.]
MLSDDVSLQLRKPSPFVACIRSDYFPASLLLAKGRSAMKPRLLFLITEDWYFVAHRLALANAAQRAGYQVSVATRINAHADVIQDAGLELHSIEMARSSVNPLDAVRERAAIEQLYRAIKPDIVHHIAMKPIVLGAAAARAARVPAIVNSIAGLGYAFASQSLRARLIKAAIRAALRKALAGAQTRVTVENQDDFEELCSRRLVDPENLRLVQGVGVDMARFNVGGIPPGPQLVILPARLLTYKGVPQFVAAARMLKSEGLDARFALVGARDPSSPASISDAQLEAWRAEGVVELWGWRSDMPKVLRQATIVCLPSHYREGLPVSLLEAAAARRCIVTTEMPGCRDIVDDGACGWIVPPRDERALAGALREALASPHKRDAFAEAAHQRALSLYDAPVIHAQMLAIYDELLRSHASAR